jgi:SAM-dependent methyltransferase
MMPSRRPYFEIANPEIPRIMRDLPRGLRVLDVGCGSGVHGAELHRVHGHQVVGVDLSASSVDKARTRLAEAYVADVTRPEEYPFSGRRQFDVILFSDMLEHLADPLGVLVRHYRLLTPNGHIVISLPNVAIWNVRLALLFGRFEYTDTGTMDRTHLRFFTRRGFHRFLAEGGLVVSRRRITPGILRPFVPLIKRVLSKRIDGKGPETDGGGDSSSIMDAAPYRAYLRLLYPLERWICGLWPGLLAFQFVILARPISVPDPTADHLSGDLAARDGEQRQKLIGHLKEREIFSVFHYQPLHLSQMGRQFGGAQGDCPVTESVSERLLRLPFYNGLDDGNLTRVVNGIHSFRS